MNRPLDLVRRRYLQEMAESKDDLLDRMDELRQLEVEFGVPLFSAEGAFHEDGACAFEAPVAQLPPKSAS